MLLKKYYADKSCLNILKVALLIFALSLTFIDYYFLFFTPILMWSLIFIFGLAYIIIGLVWLPLYFGKSSYVVSSAEVIRNTGLIVRFRHVMKVNAIQYVTLITTPFSAATGLNFVIVNALGGNLLLLYLSKPDAEEIVHTLTEAIHTRKNQL